MRSRPAFPVLVTFACMLAPGAPSAQEPNFGRALALTASELVIGQPVNWYGPGVVYLYGLTDGGEWQERARLVAPDSAIRDDFGRALALDGNTLVVGAPRKRAGRGVAYVFTRASAEAQWRYSATIEPPANVDAHEFAAALSLSGTELLVGAPVAYGTGALLHYRRTDAEWRLQGALRPDSASGALAFGAAFARAGDALVIGAPESDSARGRVYVARRSGSAWSAPQPIQLPVLAPGARVGAAVALDGERAYAGAPGAERVYELMATSPGAWPLRRELQPPDSLPRMEFGATLAPVADELWVGAPAANSGNGRVYRFAREGTSAGAALPLATIEADSADGTHWPFYFGYSIAAHGERAVVGMPQRDFGEGRVLALARAGRQWRPAALLEGEIYRLGSQVTPAAKCENGRIGEFPCANIELVAHLPTSELGGARGVWVNDVWGWTDPETRRDYALVARRDGAAFVDVTDPARPKLIGSLPRTRGSPPSVWRDIKVDANHAYIVADGALAHGMQVFDLTRLRAVADTPATFTPDTTYTMVHSAHNVVADTASHMLYIVGANGGGQSCGGGLHMVDVRDPKRPAFMGCYNDASANNSRGYTHDAQCLVYRGPDERYRGRQICVGSNETEINIADVTDKSHPVTIGRSSYPNVAYAHQGWFDDQQRYFYMDDELDELAGTVTGTRTIVWDLARLDDPVVAREYIGPVPASDHNLFVKGDRVYESNYGSGLRVLDISDRVNPREIAFFDSAPFNENEPGHSAQASGAWSNYPFFESGIIVFTSVREGLFIVRVLPEDPVT